jgi:beta-galactosidase/beta-glucuronidase
MTNAIEVVVGDVTDMEARVLARFTGQAMVTLSGTIRGPYCDNVRTLPAEFSFRNLAPQQDGVAEAIVTEPCMWSAEMPHLYHVNIDARRGEHVVATYHDKIGLRRLAPRRPVDFAPGTG